MRRFLPAALLVLPGATSAQYAYDHAVPDDIVRMERQAYGGMPKSAPPTRGYDLTYLRCAWDLDPAVRAIAGSVTSYFRAMEDLSELRFDLSDTLLVDAVSFQGSSAPFTRADDLLTIILPLTIPEGQLDSVTVTYHGVPRLTGFGSFATAQHNGTPVLWTLSEPYGAKEWWPCKQDLNDKIDSLDLYVTTPAAYKVAGNGVLVSRTAAGADSTHHWRHRYPIDHYLIATAITNYEVADRETVIDGDTIRMLAYSYPENGYEGWFNAGEVLEQLTFFSERFGLYPFAREKYGQAQFSWGGGMEHQTMSFVGYFHPDLSAHELAHQWFGDKVTCGSWADIWLNEGFATYLTGLWHEYHAPSTWHPWKQDRIDNITSAPDGSVHCPDTLSIARLFSGRLTYDKGAMVLHMLRWICGEEAFFQGVRDYLADPQLAYNTARTSDLQAHLEQASGLDLDGFFADWYTGEGYPTYTMPWSQQSDGTVDLTLYQSPSHPSVDFFALPVPVRFANAATDTIVVLDNTINGQGFSFPLPFQADQATIDPDLWLISGHNVATEVADLTRDADAVVVFPNPADDRIQWRGTAGPIVRATVLDALGRVALSDSPMAQGLDVRALPAGGYLLELSDGTTTLRTRFVKR